MDPVLAASALAAATGAVCAFLGYWAGTGAAEKRHKAREADLLDDLDDVVNVLTDMAINRHPAGRHLRLVDTEGA